MSKNPRIQHWKENKHVWKGKQREENKSLKIRFKQTMTRLKESFRVEYDSDNEYEDVD